MFILYDDDADMIWVICTPLTSLYRTIRRLLYITYLTICKKHSSFYWLVIGIAIIIVVGKSAHDMYVQYLMWVVRYVHMTDDESGSGKTVIQLYKKKVLFMDEYGEYREIKLKCSWLACVYHILNYYNCE